MKAQVTGELRTHFRPEFLNRVDEIVVFHALGNAFEANCGDSAGAVTARLAERRITLTVTPGGPGEPRPAWL